MSGDACSFCGRQADGTWFSSKCNSCGKVFCTYHSFPEDHECVGLNLNEDDNSKVRNYEDWTVSSKHRIFIACLVVAILVLSIATVLHTAPEMVSVLGRLNSYNENPVNITSETNSTSIVSASSTQYASSSQNTRAFSTTSSSTSRLQLTIDNSWVLSFMNVVNAAHENQGLANLTYTNVLSQFPQIRFDTMVENYQISHYGYDAEFQQYLAGGHC
ncbi:MAG: AN1-type zinc finger domain-containing protein [Nitrososphaerota archaeon]|nr:AN1-type zinc finger domain-containing protein [Nitrososphaerota archaeon]